MYRKHPCYCYPIRRLLFKMCINSKFKCQSVRLEEADPMKAKQKLATQSFYDLNSNVLISNCIVDIKTFGIRHHLVELFSFSLILISLDSSIRDAKKKLIADERKRKCKFVLLNRLQRVSSRFAFE